MPVICCPTSLGNWAFTWFALVAYVDSMYGNAYYVSVLLSITTPLVTNHCSLCCDYLAKMCNCFVISKFKNNNFLVVYHFWLTRQVLLRDSISVYTQCRFISLFFIHWRLPPFYFQFIFNFTARFGKAESVWAIFGNHCVKRGPIFNVSNSNPI